MGCIIPLPKILTGSCWHFNDFHCRIAVPGTRSEDEEVVFGVIVWSQAF